MSKLEKCPGCGGPLVEEVDPCEDDDKAEWVGYVCPKCSPPEV